MVGQRTMMSKMAKIVGVDRKPYMYSNEIGWKESITKLAIRKELLVRGSKS